MNSGISSGGLVHRVAKSLEQHQDSLRVKKLIFSTCQNLWENDPAVLKQFSFQDLLSTLQIRYPTVDHCKKSLYKIVSNLNHKADYTKFADDIVTAIGPLYTDSPDATLILNDLLEEDAAPPLPRPQATLATYEQIANYLDQTQQATRIKKVLYCLCHKAWENDSDRLDQIATIALVKKLRQLAPTPGELKYRLRYVLQRINRKTEYSKVVNVIFNSFQDLYSQTDDLGQVVLAAPLSSPEPPISAATQLASISAATVAISPPPSVNQNTDLDELKLDIIRYCNPLRAKILLFSVLQGPFTGSEMHWSTLKSKTLEDLLREIFAYCPTIEDLESKLTILSHCLENPVENQQITQAILKSVTAYYPPAKPAVLRSRTVKPPQVAPAQPLPLRTPAVIH